MPTARRSPPTGNLQAVTHGRSAQTRSVWAGSWMAADKSRDVHVCRATRNRHTCTSCPACLQVHFREASALVEGPLSNLKQSLVQLSRPIRVRHATPYRPAACGACAPCARWHLGTPPEHPGQLCCHHCHGPAQPDGLLHVWHNTHATLSAAQHLGSRLNRSRWWSTVLSQQCACAFSTVRI